MQKILIIVAIVVLCTSVACVSGTPGYLTVPHQNGQAFSPYTAPFAAPLATAYNSPYTPSYAPGAAFPAPYAAAFAAPFGTAYNVPLNAAYASQRVDIFNNGAFIVPAKLSPPPLRYYATPAAGLAPGPARLVAAAGVPGALRHATSLRLFL